MVLSANLEDAPRFKKKINLKKMGLSANLENAPGLLKKLYLRVTLHDRVVLNENGNSLLINISSKLLRRHDGFKCKLYN